MEEYIDYLVSAVDMIRQKFPDADKPITPEEHIHRIIDISGFPIVFDDVPGHIRPDELREALNDVFKNVEVKEEGGKVTEVRILPII